MASPYRSQDNGRRFVAGVIHVRTSSGDRALSLSHMNREPRTFRAHKPRAAEMAAFLAEERRGR